MAKFKPGWRRYQGSLSGVEKSWFTALNREYRLIRADLVDVLDRYGLSQMARSQIAEIYMGLRTSGEAIALSQVPELIQIGEAYAGLQIAHLRDANIISLTRVPSLNQEIRLALSQDLADMSWVDSSLAFMLGEMSKLKLSGETEDLVKNLLSVKLVDGRATPYRKSQNSMRQEVIARTWAGGNGVLAQIYRAVDDSTDQELMRQAVCAIDERTTDCCLNVHGQIVRQKEKFRLIGTPRFRDEMLNPPFHWYCRTAVTLYQDRMDEIPGSVTTEMMRESARAELQAREDGSRVEIHPAHATSRR